MERHQDRHQRVEGMNGVVRIPHRLMNRFVALKQALGVSHNSEVLDWLFTTYNADIETLCEGANVSTSEVRNSVPSTQNESIHGHENLQPCYGFLERQQLSNFLTLFKIRCVVVGCYSWYTETHVRDWHQCFIVTFICRKRHIYEWQSCKGEISRKIPPVTGAMFHGALSAGLSCTQLRAMCDTMGLAIPTEWVFYRFQRGSFGQMGWLDAVSSIWENKKTTLQNELRLQDQPLQVFVDVRYDSPRFAYHGTAPIIHVDTGCVLEMVTKNRIECGNSWKIEDIAVEEGLNKLASAGLRIDEVVHDDSRNGVDGLLAERGIKSQKDMWHKCKKLIKKFEKDLCEQKRQSLTCVEQCTSKSDLNSLTLSILKAWLRSKNQIVSGLKQDIVNRCAIILSLSSQSSEGSSTSSNLLYPELHEHDISYKFKSWIYTCCRRSAQLPHEDVAMLVKDIRNCALHWARDHRTCAEIDDNRACVQEIWPSNRCYYTKDGCTHNALETWLNINITESKMKFYTRARENFLSETFHGVINKYATKRIHWKKSHLARVACAALDWNENRHRECIQVINVSSQSNSVRRRPPTKRLLTKRTSNWKEDVKQKIFR